MPLGRGPRAALFVAGLMWAGFALAPAAFAQGMGGSTMMPSGGGGESEGPTLGGTGEPSGETPEAPMVTHIAIPRRQLNPEVTDVLDSFDIDNPFDLHLWFGYSYLSRSSRIRRESDSPTISSRGFIDYVDIADFTQTVQTMTFGAAVGLYHDLQVYAQVPFILEDARNLAYAAGGDPAAIDANLRDLPAVNPCSPSPCTMGDTPLFTLPFHSPKRSGIDYFALGLDWGPLNQERDDTKPTWVFGLEFRFPIGDPLTATDGTMMQTSSAISRQVWGLGAHTVFSHRYRYVAPFIGAWFRYDAPTPWGPFPAGRFPDQQNQGRLNRYPPLWGMMSFGVEFIPWENVENFQRFGIELRGDGMYTSEGRDYSELFDALGTSRHPGLYPCVDPATMSGCLEVVGNGLTGPQDTPSNFVHTGQTDVENYGTIRGSLALNIQAARYIKFTARAALAHVQDHLITFTDACNPSAQLGGQNVTRAPCTEGYPNPDHRPVIDLPGRRFLSSNGTWYEISLLGTAMF